MFEELLEDESAYASIYLEHYEKAQTDFGHYFRNLYRMIKMVHLNDFFYDIESVSEKDKFEIKYKYISIIRAQLSNHELIWIFYNCITENGYEKFKPLIEEYSLFKNIPKKLVAFPNHISLYEGRAYSPITL